MGEVKMLRERNIQHKNSLDYIRFFAILCVILTHVTESVYTLNAESLCKEALIVRWSGLAFFTIGRLGVPLFMFLTGYLMLDRTYTSQDINKLWKKKVFGMLVATEIWICVYYVFSLWIDNAKFSFFFLLRQMLFFRGASCPHLWYMPIILGLYIFLPFIANALNKIDGRILMYPVLLVVLYLFIPPIINVFCFVLGKEPLYKLLDFSFAGGEYGILLIIGWMIKKGYFARVKSIYFFFLGIGSYAVTLAVELYAYSHGVTYNVWYDSLTLLVASFSIFNLFLKMKIKKDSLNQLIGWFSRISFAVYLSHEMFVVLLSRHLQIENYFVREGIIFFWSVVIGFFVAGVLCLNKKVGNILFNFK